MTESQLALDGNYDQASCLRHVGTEGRGCRPDVVGHDSHGQLFVVALAALRRTHAVRIIAWAPGAEAAAGDSGQSDQIGSDRERFEIQEVAAQ